VDIEAEDQAARLSITIAEAVLPWKIAKWLAVAKDSN
jgi:hypothetical protein